jgi:hypothetical protein
VPGGPAEVHPEEHLGPVRGLRAAGAGADREQRAALVVLAGEQQRRALALEVRGERVGLALELRCQFGISALLDQLERRKNVVDALLDAAPQLDLGAEAVRLAEDLLGASLVVPEPGLGRLGLELRGARFLGG